MCFVDFTRPLDLFALYVRDNATYLQRRSVTGGEREWRLALIGNEIRWHCIGHMYGNMGIQPSAALPVLHGGTATELFCQVINTVLPLFKVYTAEAAPGLDVSRFRLPRLHAGCHLASVHESKVLSEVIFAVKGTRLRALFVTSCMVMCSKVLAARI
jgi:hypothetical protein